MKTSEGLSPSASQASPPPNRGSPVYSVCKLALADGTQYVGKVLDNSFIGPSLNLTLDPAIEVDIKTIGRSNRFTMKRIHERFERKFTVSQVNHEEALSPAATDPDHASEISSIHRTFVSTQGDTITLSNHKLVIEFVDRIIRSGSALFASSA